MKINVLGTKYEVLVKKEADDPRLNEGIDGYCDTSTKVCVVEEMKTADPRAKGNLPEYQKQVKRHEIIHAFLFESGLDTSSWGCNEEMVDWFAIQFGKLRKAFEEADCL